MIDGSQLPNCTGRSSVRFGSPWFDGIDLIPGQNADDEMFRQYVSEANVGLWAYLLAQHLRVKLLSDINSLYESLQCAGVL